MYHSNRRDFIKSTLSLSALALFPKFNLKALSKDLPNVLIIGDSISMGYTPFVKQFLEGEANVSHPDENCGPTERGIAHMAKWLDGTKYKVIHFNFGLHDLKHVDAVTKKASTKPSDPLMTDLKTYEKNLQIIVDKLKTTGAKLIFATTTPVPLHSSPLRDPQLPVEYNSVAEKVMNKNHIVIDDLYNFVLPQADKIRKPNNVHYTEEGYKLLGKKVADAISKYI
jgi:acyl-CoA thioesterase-1